MCRRERASGQTVAKVHDGDALDCTQHRPHSLLVITQEALHKMRRYMRGQDLGFCWLPTSLVHPASSRIPVHGIFKKLPGPFHISPASSKDAIVLHTSRGLRIRKKEREKKKGKGYVDIKSRIGVNVARAWFRVTISAGSFHARALLDAVYNNFFSYHPSSSPLHCDVFCGGTHTV